MDWLILALLSSAAFALAVLLDKLLLSYYMRSSIAYLVILVLFQQAFVFLVYALVGVSFIYPISLYGMLAGATQAMGFLSYLRALQVEEATRVTFLIFVYPIFVFLGSALLLDEVLAPADYLGGIMLVISAVLVSYRPLPGGIPAFSASLKYIFLSWIFASLYAIEIKYLLSFLEEWDLLIWASLGMLLSVLPFLANMGIRAEVFGIFRAGSFALGAILLEELFDFLGRILSIFAFAIGPVSLVSAVGALQPSIILVYILALNFYMPGLLDEELDRKTLALKLTAGVLVVIGIYLISQI